MMFKSFLNQEERELIAKEELKKELLKNDVPSYMYSNCWDLATTVARVLNDIKTTLEEQTLIEGEITTLKQKLRFNQDLFDLESQIERTKAELKDLKDVKTVNLELEELSSKKRQLEIKLEEQEMDIDVLRKMFETDQQIEKRKLESEFELKEKALQQQILELQTKHQIEIQQVRNDLLEKFANDTLTSQKDITQTITDLAKTMAQRVA